ncbi:hypothetical protein ACHAWF_009232 [Thalassiosira exigua]
MECTPRSPTRCSSDCFNCPSRPHGRNPRIFSDGTNIIRPFPEFESGVNSETGQIEKWYESDSSLERIIKIPIDNFPAPPFSFNSPMEGNNEAEESDATFKVRKRPGHKAPKAADVPILPPPFHYQKKEEKTAQQSQATKAKSNVESTS